MSQDRDRIRDSGSCRERKGKIRVFERVLFSTLIAEESGNSPTAALSLNRWNWDRFFARLERETTHASPRISQDENPDRRLNLLGKLKIEFEKND